MDRDFKQYHRGEIYFANLILPMAVSTAVSALC